MTLPDNQTKFGMDRIEFETYWADNFPRQIPYLILTLILGLVAYYIYTLDGGWFVSVIWFVPFLGMLIAGAAFIHSLPVLRRVPIAFDQDGIEFSQVCTWDEIRSAGFTADKLLLEFSDQPGKIAKLSLKLLDAKERAQLERLVQSKIHN